jgi:hypothetical protein
VKVLIETLFSLSLPLSLLSPPAQPAAAPGEQKITKNTDLQFGTDDDE